VKNINYIKYFLDLGFFPEESVIAIRQGRSGNPVDIKSKTRDGRAPLCCARHDKIFLDL